jgi:hypothetical protein
MIMFAVSDDDERGVYERITTETSSARSDGSTISAVAALLPSHLGETSAAAEQWYWYPGDNLYMKSTGKETAGKITWTLNENSPSKRGSLRQMNPPFPAIRDQTELAHLPENALCVNASRVSPSRYSP